MLTGVTEDAAAGVAPPAGVGTATAVLLGLVPEREAAAAARSVAEKKVV